MTRLLLKIFIGTRDMSDAGVRGRCGFLAGATAVFCNLTLFVLKLILGMMSGSVAITADAFNNLSDVGSAGVTLFGFYIAAKPADREHPYGHGRSEYVGGLAVAFLVLLVGFEFLKSSVVKIVNPQPIVFSWITVAGLVISVLIKLWLSSFQKTVGSKINSAALEATSADSISDVMATSVTLIAVAAAPFTTFPVDGYMGAVVALIIICTGIKVAKDTLALLLGQAPDPKLLDSIRNIALNCEGILGVHDLIVHDYGPGRIYASMHAEVDMWRGIKESHELIDRVEKQISASLGVDMVLHIDPQDTTCRLTNEQRAKIESLIEAYDPAFKIHDFRAEKEKDGVRVSFDISIPIEYKNKDQDICRELISAIKREDVSLIPEITIDRVV